MIKQESSLQPSMLVLFLINLIVALLWRVFLPLTGWFDLGIGFIAGLVVLTIINREYGRRGFHLFTFSLYVVWQIILSNVKLAWTIVQPQERFEAELKPGIVAVPLTVSHGMEIMILASVITLTPGTISVDLGKQEDGEQVLYVHNLQLEDVDHFIREIKDGFEQRIMRFTRGTKATTAESEGPA